MVNTIAQGVSDAASIANDILIGAVVVATIIGVATGLKANYDENVQFITDYGISKEDVGTLNLIFRDVDEGGGAPIGEILSGIGRAYKKAFLNPLGIGLIFGTIGLDVASNILNNLAHTIQAPILYFLVPEGVVAVNLSEISESQVNEMLNDLNESYANFIEQQGYCSDPTSWQCQNLYATYLIAKYLFYTFGETLGQSVTISGNHNEYALILFDYESNYSVTLNDVLCMLEMMKYYNQVPLEDMYGGYDVIWGSNSNMACYVYSRQSSSTFNQILENTLQSSHEYITNVYNKLLVKAFVVDNQSGSISETDYNSTASDLPPNQITIIPATISSQNSGSTFSSNGMIIQYTYEGGNRAIILTSIIGEN
jgi:hypothetical protein